MARVRKGRSCSPAHRAPVITALDERDSVSGSLKGSKVGKAKRLKRLKLTKHLDIENRFAELMTKNFQTELRNSEIWEQMVAEFGEKRAQEILKQCKAEVKHNI